LQQVHQAGGFLRYSVTRGIATCGEGLCPRFEPAVAVQGVNLCPDGIDLIGGVVRQTGCALHPCCGFEGFAQAEVGGLQVAVAAVGVFFGQRNQQGFGNFRWGCRVFGKKPLGYHVIFGDTILGGKPLDEERVQQFAIKVKITDEFASRQRRYLTGTLLDLGQETLSLISAKRVKAQLLQGQPPEDSGSPDPFPEGYKIVAGNYRQLWTIPCHSGTTACQRS